jgi:hypothetical protein
MTKTIAFKANTNAFVANTIDFKANTFAFMTNTNVSVINTFAFMTKAICGNVGNRVKGPGTCFLEEEPNAKIPRASVSGPALSVQSCKMAARRYNGSIFQALA